jgi:hypothetical protein
MNAFKRTHRISAVAAAAALALASGAALSGDGQPFGRSSVYATATSHTTITTSAVGVERAGRGSVYVWDTRAAPSEVSITSRSPAFESNGRGSVYALQLDKRRSGVDLASRIRDAFGG